MYEVRTCHTLNLTPRQVSDGRCRNRHLRSTYVQQYTKLIASQQSGDRCCHRHLCSSCFRKLYLVLRNQQNPQGIMDVRSYTGTVQFAAVVYININNIGAVPLNLVYHIFTYAREPYVVSRASYVRCKPCRAWARPSGGYAHDFWLAERSPKTVESRQSQTEYILVRTYTPAGIVVYMQVYIMRVPSVRLRPRLVFYSCFTTVVPKRYLSFVSKWSGASVVGHCRPSPPKNYISSQHTTPE